MDTICNIKYVDAHFSYAKDIGATKLPVQEAYGYVERNSDAIVICFIKKRGTSVAEMIKKRENLIKGLVIPDTALTSMVNTYPIDVLNGVSSGSSVSVTWRDVRYIANLSLYECAVMNTAGELFRIGKDNIVIKNPKTMRIYPVPIMQHPEKGTPTYLMVPISAITAITPDP